MRGVEKIADPYFAEAWGTFAVTIGSTDVTAGDALYFDGTDWELADADDNTKFAEAFAAQSYSAGEKGVACLGGILVDTDAPYTQADEMYLSETAGAITATRPTTANSLRQVLGFCLSTSEVHVRVKMPEEFSIWVDLPYAGGSAAVTIDGDWAGLSMTADADAAHGTGIFPANTVGLAYAGLWGYNEDALATGNYTIDVSAGKDGDTGTTASDGITTTAVSETTADDIWKEDATTAFDAAGIVEAENHFGVDVAKASETAADDYRYHGVEVVVYVV